MKRFKELRNEISELQESETSEGGSFGYDAAPKGQGRSAIGNGHTPAYKYEDSAQLDKINAFLHAFTSNTYIDPKSALFLLRAKLNLTGIDFDLTRAKELQPDTEYEFPLKRFGGTFGTSPQHDLSKGFEVTNGFGDRNFVLTIIISSSKTSVGNETADRGPYTIQAAITEK